MQETKRWRITFREIGGHRQRTIRTLCTEEELQGEKERLAMIVEEEIGAAVRCVEVKEDQRRP